MKDEFYEIFDKFEAGEITEKEASERLEKLRKENGRDKSKDNRTAS